MKKIISILLVVIYSFGLLKPLSPYICDFVAHTFWEYEHIATIHYSEGKYHVHVEVESLVKKEANPINKSQKIDKQENLSVHLGGLITRFLEENRSTNTISDLDRKIRACFFEINIPPPKVI